MIFFVCSGTTCNEMMFDKDKLSMSGCCTSDFTFKIVYLVKPNHQNIYKPNKDQKVCRLKPKLTVSNLFTKYQTITIFMYVDQGLAGVLSSAVASPPTHLSRGLSLRTLAPPCSLFSTSVCSVCLRKSAARRHLIKGLHNRAEQQETWLNSMK